MQCRGGLKKGREGEEEEEELAVLAGLRNKNRLCFSYSQAKGLDLLLEFTSFFCVHPCDLSVVDVRRAIKNKVTRF